jgi:hypothetical protein
MAKCSCSSHGGFLTAKGLEEAAQRLAAQREFDGMGTSAYVDRVGSVSAFEPSRDTLWLADDLTEEQYRRFVNAVEA